MKRKISALFLTLFITAPLYAAEYNFDTKGHHAFVQFRIQHLGYSWLYGRFDDFDGSFNYDEKDPSNSSISTTIKTASVNSNNAERDKHLRSEDFLDVDQFPEARFVSTSISPNAEGTMANITGDLTLHGVTKQITLETDIIGSGQDPWGGYRAGFLAKTTLTLKDFDIDFDLGPASTQVEITLSIEGVRQ